MTRKNWLLILALIAILAAGAYVARSGLRSSTTPTTPAAQESAGIANPASTHCVSLGGTLEMMDTPGGQTGLCHLPDGRVCEEWALFRDGSCSLPQ
ncbi:DUF333 domain-containing protein [Candidatus Kaiserbacteria bacterium]|nr:DUF333 domain-containing protein [Candidatus Kaiserbacteria bacterium]